MMELIKNTNIDFMGIKKYTFAFSGVLTLLGLLGVVQIYRGHANLGIDLAGGTSLQLRFRSRCRWTKFASLAGAGAR